MNKNLGTDLFFVDHVCLVGAPLDKARGVG